MSGPTVADVLAEWFHRELGYRCRHEPDVAYSVRPTCEAWAEQFRRTALQPLIDAEVSRRVDAEVRAGVEEALDEARQGIEAARNKHWQKHLREHPLADARSCPDDYAKHDAYAHAAKIVRAARRAAPEAGAES